MKALIKETVTSVHHWSDHLFTFKTTRNEAFRFSNGEFTMIGLEVEGKPLMRAYSIASANYEDELEFFSIIVQNGPLTSELQHLKVGDTVLVNTKPTGTLLIDRLLPAKRLYLISTGTGLAPFLSIVRDPETYEKFEQVILTHGVRTVEALAYKELIQESLPKHEYLGEMISKQLYYYPTVTREPYHNAGRLTDLLKSGKLCEDLGFSEINVEEDRFMICGSMALNKDMTELLTGKGFVESRRGQQAHFVIERAFVSR